MNLPPFTVLGRINGQPVAVFRGTWDQCDIFLRARKFNDYWLVETRSLGERHD